MTKVADFLRANSLPDSPAGRAAGLLDEAERALERAQDHLYNPFEPANQCAAYHDVTAALANLRGEA